IRDDLVTGVQTCALPISYIYEYNDFAVGLTDAGGMLIAQCTGGMPPFVADSVGTAVRDGLSIYGAARLQPGDVVLCNHAAVQGQIGRASCRESGGRRGGG